MMTVPRRARLETPLLMARIFSRSFLILFGILLPLLAVELGLQVAAFYASRSAVTDIERGRSARTSRTILCVGDSYTYGSGASTRENSYPGRLAQELAEASDWNVINAGWPGRNSAQVMQRIPGMLAEYQPNVLCLLIGRNNRWNREEIDLPPPALDQVADLDAQGWEWRWRTARLISICWGRIRGREDTRPSEPAVVVEPSKPARSESPRPPSPSPSPRRSVPESPEQRAKRLARKKAVEDLADSPDYQPIQQSLQLLEDNKKDAAAKVLADARDRFRESTDLITIEEYVKVLEDLRHHQTTVEECQFFLQEFPESEILWGTLAGPLAHLKRLDEAYHAVGEAFRCTGGDQKAWLFNARATVHKAARKYDSALDDFVTAYALSGNQQLLASNLSRLGQHSPDVFDDLAGAMERLELPPDARAVVLDTVAEIRQHWTTTEEGVPLHIQKLTDDLSSIQGLCEQAGVDLMLLTYPTDIEESRCIRRFAEEAGVPFLDLVPIFGKLLEAAKPSDYFIPDGHPNDAGYLIIAREVTQIVL